MEIEDLVRLIKEELGEMEINQVVLAVTEGFGRVHPDGDLLWFALPKHDKEARKRIMDHAYCIAVK